MPPLVAIDARDAGAVELKGWGRYARALVEAMRTGAADGFEVHALTDGGAGPAVLFEQVKLPVRLRRRRAAMIHSTNCFLPLARPCPGVVTVHDLAFEAWPLDFRGRTRAKYLLFARLASRSAQRIICPSAFTRGDLVERYRVDQGKIRVIPEAPALPTGEHDPPPGPYLLAVGDLRRKKNLRVLVRAFVELRRREGIPHRLVLAGAEAGEGPVLRVLAGAQPVELTGYLPDPQLDALIRGADVLVHPSLYEGFGLVVLEAMARGTPVLAARASALPETGGEAAAYFEPDDPDGLRAALGSLLDDAGARAELSRRGREWAARFSWARTAQDTAAVYRELL
jgi:glycosyltransferase involved in cell wall biosynthesis